MISRDCFGNLVFSFVKTGCNSVICFRTNENGNEHGPRLPSRRASRRENVQPTTRGGGGGGGRRERNHHVEEEPVSESESQSDSETGSDKEDTEADEENQRPRRAGGRRVNPVHE